MRIGELARRAVVTPGAIRYYERSGLLPEPPRTPSGYRTYSRRDLLRLRFIRAAQSVGLTLAEIREILAARDHGDVPCPRVAAFIDRHLEELDRRIAELTHMRARLARLAGTARRRDRAAEEAAFCHIIETGTPGGRLVRAGSR